MNGLIVMQSPMFAAQRQAIVELAAKHRLPAIYEWGFYAESGGLISYGANLPDEYRRVTPYEDKILKGTKPADLPVEQPTKFELVVNLKTAKALGLMIRNRCSLAPTRSSSKAGNGRLTGERETLFKQELTFPLKFSCSGFRADGHEQV